MSIQNTIGLIAFVIFVAMIGVSIYYNRGKNNDKDLQ